jgi:large subunit ribosomal protein L13
MSTYSAKPAEVKQAWWIIDAEDVILGRLATLTAKMLRGKHKTMFTPHIDTGDHIVIVNAEKIKITGKKRTQKRYYWHTGYPGGIKEASPQFILSGKHPERVIESAVLRMLPKESPLARQQLRKLHVYAGPGHPHEAQQPKSLDMAALNPKNKR